MCYNFYMYFQIDFKRDQYDHDSSNYVITMLMEFQNVHNIEDINVEVLYAKNSNIQLSRYIVILVL